MKEKTVDSPAERGEYLLYDDETAADGSPCVSVSFRKTTADGTPDEYDFEPWKTFATWDEAEKAVEGEIAEAKAAWKA